jgi:hypothetical protein
MFTMAFFSKSVILRMRKNFFFLHFIYNFHNLYVLISAYSPVDAATTITYNIQSVSMNGWMIIFIFLHKTRYWEWCAKWGKKKKLLLKIRYLMWKSIILWIAWITYILALSQACCSYTLFFGVWREIKQNFYVFSFRFQSFSSPCHAILISNCTRKWLVDDDDVPYTPNLTFQSFYDLSFCFLSKFERIAVLRWWKFFLLKKGGTEEHKIWSHW